LYFYRGETTMNTVYALLLITSTGITEGFTFDSMAACQALSSKIKESEFTGDKVYYRTLCVEKKVPDPNAQIKQIMSMFKNMVAEMKEIQK